MWLRRELQRLIGQATVNYFELFGLESSFDIDISALAPVYQQLQRKFHPDQFATSSAQEKLLAVQKTAEINDAYSTLKNPSLRAEYLLGLRGLVLNHEQQTYQDNGFLIQQMMMREALEEAPESDDPEQSLADLEAEVMGLKNDFMQDLSLQLANGQQDSEAANTVRKLKFIIKLEDEISRLEDALFDD